jgi:hypothetical protein
LSADCRARLDERAVGLGALALMVELFVAPEGGSMCSRVNVIGLKDIVAFCCEDEVGKLEDSGVFACKDIIAGLALYRVGEKAAVESRKSETAATCFPPCRAPIASPTFLLASSCAPRRRRSGRCHGLCAWMAYTLCGGSCRSCICHTSQLSVSSCHSGCRPCCRVCPGGALFGIWGTAEEVGLAAGMVASLFAAAAVETRAAAAAVVEAAVAAAVGAEAAALGAG